MRKKRLLVVVLLAQFLLAGGCQKNMFPVPYEIQEIEVVQVIGVDRCAKDPSLVEVTFMSLSQRQTASENSGSQQVVTVVSETGDTVFDAKRKLKVHSDKTAVLSHIRYILIGEEAAKEDFIKYFDCFLRDSELRLTPKVYIVRGCPVKELMQKSSTGDKFLAERLKVVKHDVELISNSGQLDLVEVTGMLDDKTAAAVIPTLRCGDVGEERFTGEMPEKEVLPCGYAILKDFKLAGYYEADISRGYNFLTDDVRYANYTVRDKTGMKVELDVKSAEVSVKAEFDGEQLKRVTYKAEVRSMVREQQSVEDIYEPDSLREMEKQLAEAIKDEMMRVIETSKELGTDAIGLGQRLRLAHPLRWDKLKDGWKDTFPSLDIQAEVHVKLRSTLSIQNPVGYREENG